MYVPPTQFETNADLRRRIDAEIERKCNPPDAIYPHVTGGFPFSPKAGTYWAKAA